MVPKRRDIFAVHHGDYAGQMFVFCEKDENKYKFLSLPDMSNIDIPRETFNYGISNDIVKYVEKSPKKVFRTIIKQYRKNVSKSVNI